MRLLGRPLTREPSDPTRDAGAGVVREWCATISLRFGATIPKHFALLSLKMMLRSFPEVVRSSENDKTFDHGTYSCLTFFLSTQTAKEHQERPEAEQQSLEAEQESLGA